MEKIIKATIMFCAALRNYEREIKQKGSNKEKLRFLAMKHNFKFK